MRKHIQDFSKFSRSLNENESEEEEEEQSHKKYSSDDALESGNYHFVTFDELMADEDTETGNGTDDSMAADKIENNVVDDTE